MLRFDGQQSDRSRFTLPAEPRIARSELEVLTDPPDTRVHVSALFDYERRIALDGRDHVEIGGRSHSALAVGDLGPLLSLGLHCIIVGAVENIGDAVGQGFPHHRAIAMFNISVGDSSKDHCSPSSRTDLRNGVLVESDEALAPFLIPPRSAPDIAVLKLPPLSDGDLQMAMLGSDGGQWFSQAGEPVLVSRK